MIGDAFLNTHTLLCNKQSKITRALCPDLDKQLFSAECFFAGGCIASSLSGEPVKDWDMFVRTGKYLDELRSAMADHANTVAVTENAVTLDIDGDIFQLITRVHGEPASVVSKFDFLHTQCWFSFYNCGMFMDPVVEKACTRKALIPTLPEEELSPERVQRFLKRGWVLTDTDKFRGLLKLVELYEKDQAKDQPPSWGS